MGTSTAGEIADGFLRNSVVVTLLCSPHINVKLGMGEGVSQDYQKAVDEALKNAHISEYFNARFPEHQMLNVSASGTLGVSPVLLMLFTPGATKNTFSLTHDYKEELRAVLNLYAPAEKTFLFYPDHISDNIAFLEGISSQVAMFIENRSLSKHSTFYREIHHRVKNNLQNIAALLRMQLRRLDHVSPEQALTDSISRIMSIALVHETLSEGQIGMVDLGRLVGSISKAAETDRTSRAWITLDVSEHPVMIPSREATSVALVVNELIQNALEHGIKKKDDGRVSVKIRQVKNMITVTVQDDGPGFPENFDPEQHGNLGLTIVQTLAGEELKGVFEIRSDHGATTELTFPLPQGYHPMKARSDI